MTCVPGKTGKNFDIPDALIGQIDAYMARMKREHRIAIKSGDLGTAALLGFLSLTWEEQKPLIMRARNYDIEVAGQVPAPDSSISKTTRGVLAGQRGQRKRAKAKSDRQSEAG